MRHRSSTAVVFAALGFVAIACGEVPTLDGGIAYISPIILPSPAVAAGDVLRDSLGRVAPLTVQAYDKDDNLISGVSASYVISTIPAQVLVDASGKVTAFDTVGSVQIVARIGDRLQTTAATLEVVPQPDSIVASGTRDSLTVGVPSSSLQALVTGVRRTLRSNVKGIVVRYRIVGISPGTSIDPTRAFFADGIRGDLLRAVDTTDGSGIASKAVTISTSAGIDAVTVEATANSLLGQPLRGSPVRFVLPVKRGQ